MAEEGEPIMKRIATSFAFVGATLLTSWSAADPAVALVPGSVQEQRLVLPAREADVAHILEQLGRKEQGVGEASLQWLLRREEAERLSYFHTNSIRFSVEAVTKVSVRGDTWRLVECVYLSRDAERSGPTEYRSRWAVAYVFDGKGRLRDWVEDYDVAVLRDINNDGQVELVAYIDSPKRVIVYSYEPGRSRELLRVDDVPEHGDLLKRTPRKEGGEYMTYEKPVELIADNASSAARMKVAQHGVYKWDARQQRYVNETAARS
jgi:hypothetical protein